MLLFILHYSHSISSAFAQKTIFCNENSNFINFPYYFQLCHRLYPLLQISSVICLIRLLEHNLPGQIFSHIFLFKPRLYEKRKTAYPTCSIYSLLYLPFDCFISAAPATAFPLFSDTSFPSSLSYESGPGYAHPHWQGGRKSHPPARRPACGSHLFPLHLFLQLPDLYGYKPATHLSTKPARQYSDSVDRFRHRA